MRRSCWILGTKRFVIILLIFNRVSDYKSTRYHYFCVDLLLFSFKCDLINWNDLFAYLHRFKRTRSSVENVELTARSLYWDIFCSLSGGRQTSIKIHLHTRIQTATDETYFKRKKLTDEPSCEWTSVRSCIHGFWFGYRHISALPTLQHSALGVSIVFRVRYSACLQL